MKKTLKQKMRASELALGSWITLAHPAIAEIMARAGFDWLAVDLEHSVITIREAEELLRVISLVGATPLVRLTSNDANLIKRVMDGGAHGVIVPMINSVEDARRAVDSVYYPTRGKRGVGLARAQGYGTSFAQYREWLETEAVVVAQIEHINGVEQAEGILSLDGIDGYIIGPYDLSASLGVPGDFSNPRVVEAMEHVREVGRKIGKPGGLHIIEPDHALLKQKIEEGARFLAYSLDIRLLDTGCRAGIEQVRGERK